VVELDEACRRQQLGEGWFPTRAIVCTVPDARKATAVRGAVEGPVTNALPASILQTHAKCDMYMDWAAARLLDPARLGSQV